MRPRTFLYTLLTVISLAGGLCVHGQTPAPSPMPTVDEAKQAVFNKVYNEGIELFRTGTPAALRSAIGKFVDARQLAAGAGNKYSETVSLTMAGSSWLKLGDESRALEYFVQAYDVHPPDEESIEADLLQNMGLIYSNQGDHAKALQYFMHERELRNKQKDVKAEISALHNTAMVLNEIGDMHWAKDIYEEIVKLERSGHGDNRILAASINNLAYVYYRLENFAKAAELYDEAYQIAVKDDYEDVQSATQIGLGDAFHKLNDQTKAIHYYNRGLEMARKVRNPIFEGDALYGLGTVYQIKGEKRRAVDFYDQALALQVAVKAREQESKTLSAEMSVWRELGQPQLAIFYGKRAVNLNQTMRAMLEGLSKEMQRMYLRSKEAAYRDLSNLLIAEGRLPEAQGVLDLLKEQEYEQFTKLRSGESAETVPYSKAEGEIVAKIDGLAILTRRKSDLEEKGTLSAGEQAVLDTILEDMEAANRAFRTSLEALGKNEASVSGKILEIEADKNLQKSLALLRTELKTGLVAIYTVIGTEEVKAPATGAAKSTFRTKFGWVILVTPEGRKAYPIDVTGLEENVQQFHGALRTSDHDPRPIAQKLYDAIFRQTSPKQKRTLEQDLAEVFAKYQDKTIMWSLDGVLRYVPMAALHDGKNYLVEKYRNTVFTNQSLLLLNQKDSPKWETLGLGVSVPRTVDNQNFIALEGTKRELEDIVREPNEKTGILEGTRKLNQEFTKSATMQLLRTGKYQAVHVASHFSFNPLDPTASFLVIGDGKLTFADIQDKDNLLGSVDLLTLSACDTAMSSNGKESEGFPFLAQSLGAKTVIASLWKVSDTGTPELMIRFYKLRAENPSMSKGEAFRQAQLSLLTGTAGPAGPQGKVRRSDPISLDETGPTLSPFVVDPAKPFAHPHYWASFVLIGNWR